MSRKELAAALGISRVMLWRLERAGMPVNSVRDAVAWRAANLTQSRMKGVKAGTTVSIPPAEPATVNVAPGEVQSSGEVSTFLGEPPPPKTVAPPEPATPLAESKVQWQAGQRRRSARDRDAWQRDRPDAFPVDHWLDPFIDRWKQ
jgi:hypothetical protein